MLLRLALVVCLLLSSPVLAQDIPVEKYKLANGMTVILRQDKSLPVAAVNIWYRVGAKDELPGRSGFAHLFEHLMFMGTARVPGNEFDVIMETGGGANNASTSLDRTNYFSSGPSSLLPTLLWLDADRLEDLGRMMDQDKLNKQRDIVRNELRQMVENAPYGKAYERMFRLMYPAGHPYHEAVYGTHEDLEAASVGNVKDFFATYYVPCNASLVVAGDFDPASIKPLIETLFGSIPRGGDVTRKPTPPTPKLDRVIRLTMLDKVQLPMVKMAWHSPAWYADGDAEMELLAAVLAQGKNSRLYKRLVFDEKLAVDVAADQDAGGLGSLFTIDVTTTPGADLGRIEQVVDEELARIGKDGITPSELEDRKATTELAKLAGLQSVESIADRLNEYEYIWGEPNSFKRDFDRFRNATPAKVQWWAMQTLDPGRRSIIRVLPEEPERAESPRDKRPADLSPRDFSPPSPESFTLKSGIPVLLWRKSDLPLVALHIQFKQSSPISNASTAGLAALTAQMLEEGTQSLDSLAFSAAMQGCGAHFSAAAGHESADVSLTVVKRNFARATKLAADAVGKPRMAASDWDRVKRLHLDDLRQQDEEPTIVAARVADAALFGAGNPYGVPVSGTIPSVERLTLEDVKKAHASLFRPELATIFISGDVTAQEAKAILDEAFGSAPRGNVPTTTRPDLSAKPGSSLRVFIVDRPEAVQTVIRFAAPGPKFGDPGRARYQLLSTALGGSFSSRLNLNLRERNNFTYGARSAFAMAPCAGSFSARASVKADTTGAALKEFFAEFDRLRAGPAGDITDSEATKVRETLRAETIQTFAGVGGVLGAAAELSLNDLPFDTIAKDLATIAKVTAPELNAMSKAAIPIDQGVLVLVGDKKLILEQIKELKLPSPVEVDPLGQPIK